MSTPEFISALRKSIGHTELFLPGVSAVVLREDGDGGKQVLLVRRSDTGAWTVTSGIPEPGEQPAETALREVAEETSLMVEVTRLAGVWTQPPIEYPNGDQCRFIDIVLRCQPVSGEATVNDDESTHVGWFPVDDLPDGLSPNQRQKIQWALPETGPGSFITPGAGSVGPNQAAQDSGGAEPTD